MKRIIGGLAAAAIGLGGAVTTQVINPAPANACSSGTSPAVHTYADSLPFITYGDNGSAVMGLQLYLREHGYPYLTGTGNYGANTRKAVEDFKGKHGRVRNADVGTKTWEQIITSRYQVPVRFPNPQTAPGERLSGDRGFWLSELAITRTYDLPWFNTAHTDGVYDGALVQSVKTFQHRVGLNPSGIFGARTTGKLTTVVSIAGHWGC